MAFVDLTKAFDTVSRDGLWKIMAKFGCSLRFIAMVRQFHDDMQARVQNDGEFSEPFEVTNGVKQGCVMAPTLLSMMFKVMLMDAFHDSDTGFSWLGPELLVCCLAHRGPTGVFLLLRS